MTIEIDDKYLEYLKRMPPIKENSGKRAKNHSVLYWIEKNYKLGYYIISYQVLRAIVERGKELGILVYDVATRTWRGADYGN